MNRSLFLSVLLGWTGSLCAQTPDALSEKDFFTEMPIVLSVSRLPQRLDDTPGAVTILDREMIRLSGARDVADLLRLVPGFQTSTSFESGAPLASYHGAFGQFSARMQVLVDGRSVYSPYLLGSVSPGMLTVALEDIERIEVLRGSNSAAYGARAMLGVVNIVTRHTGDTLGGLVVVAQGENGIRDRLARIGWGDAETSYRLTMDQRGDDGLKGANGHNQVNRVNLRVDWRPNSRDDVQLRVGGFELNSGKGFQGLVSDPLRDRNMNSSYVQVDWRRSLDADDDLAFTLAHAEEVSQDSFLHPLGPLVDFGGRSRSDTVSLQHTFRSGPDWRIVWGGELRREQINSRPLYNTDEALVTDFTRLFGNAEWRVAPDVILNAGGMLENSSVHGGSFAPRVMLNWHAAAGHTLRAGVSKAYRPPSAYEKFSDVRYLVGGLPYVTVQSSGNVQSERLLVRELGYLGDFPALGLNFDARLFHEQMDGFVRRTTSTPTDFLNNEDFVIQGLEYQLKWRPWLDAQLIIGQTYTDIRSTDQSTALAAPELASTITFFQKLPGGIDLSVMHQDSGTAVLPASGYDDRVAMTRTDLRLGWPLRVGKNKGEIAVVVQNLGSPYQDYDRKFRFERRAFITLRLEN